MNNLSNERVSGVLFNLESSSQDAAGMFEVSEDDVVDICHFLSELLALREAQSKPVAWDYEWASYITCEGPQDFKRVIEREAPPEWAIEEGQARNIIPLYAAPQPPAVPDEHVRREVNAGGNKWVQCSKRAYEKHKADGKHVRELYERPQSIATEPQNPQQNIPEIIPESCLWSSNDEGVWEGQCGLEWQFLDGDSDPQENGAKFCPRCGRPIAAAPEPE